MIFSLLKSNKMVRNLLHRKSKILKIRTKIERRSKFMRKNLTELLRQWPALWEQKASPG